MVRDALVPYCAAGNARSVESKLVEVEHVSEAYDGTYRAVLGMKLI